jgi:hypothetical protein
MSAKATGLAAFARGAKSQEQAKEAPVKKRPRGEKALVALTVRVLRDDWERLHHLAISKGVSMQDLALRGFSLILMEEGLPPI